MLISTMLAEGINDDYLGDDGGSSSDKEMEVLRNFIYGRISQISSTMRNNHRQFLIHLQFEFETEYNTVFNENPDNKNVYTFRSSWSTLDDTWEIVSYFCISDPVFHQDELDDFNVEVLSFFVDSARDYDMLVDYDPLNFLDSWSQILHDAIFNNGTAGRSYVFKLNDEEKIKQQAKDAISRVKKMYD